MKGKSFTTSKNDYRDLEGRDSDSFLLISLQTSLKQGYTAERKLITPFAALSCLLQLLSPFQDLVRRLHGTRKTQNGTPVTHHARLSTMGSLEWSELSSPSRVLSFSQLLFHVRYALHATPERDVTIVWYAVSQNGKEMRKRILFSRQKFLIIMVSC